MYRFNGKNKYSLLIQADRPEIQVLTLLHTNCVKFTWVESLKSVLPKVWSQASNINIIMMHVQA